FSALALRAASNALPSIKEFPRGSSVFITSSESCLAPLLAPSHSSSSDSHNLSGPSSFLCTISENQFDQCYQWLGFDLPAIISWL
ncbi:MAG TPA: hypothetical protein VHQ22_12815, partial [Terriglobales bacterium]|nr:hypothetical protein [Terriglobales bacterium]